MLSNMSTRMAVNMIPGVVFILLIVIVCAFLIDLDAPAVLTECEDMQDAIAETLEGIYAN